MTHRKFHRSIASKFRKKPQVISKIVRSIIELIDPVRTDRNHIDELEKTEKTYIGTKIEIVLRYHLEVERGSTQDCKIGGTEFDIKCTVAGNNWMIPREAVNHFCLLVKIDWDSRKIWIGTFLAKPIYLSPGTNQDLKRGLTPKGKSTIKWIVESGDFRIPNLVPYIQWRKAA